MQKDIDVAITEKDRVLATIKAIEDEIKKANEATAAAGQAAADVKNAKNARLVELEAHLAEAKRNGKQAEEGEAKVRAHLERHMTEFTGVQEKLKGLQSMDLLFHVGQKT